MVNFYSAKLISEKIGEIPFEYVIFNKGLMAFYHSQNDSTL